MMAAAQCMVPKSVATNIKSDEPIAVFTHFYMVTLSINLAASDNMKTSRIMKDALETTHEITRLIKYSPKRDAKLKQIIGRLLKDNCNAESVCYAQQDGQYELMPLPVLFQIIVCSMNCGIGHWIIAQSLK